MTKSKYMNLANCKEIASGGEGKILEHPTDPKKVIKLYHQPRKSEFEKHLESLSTLSDRFVRPKELFYTKSGVGIAGIIMDYVNFNDYWLFNNLFNKGFCTTNNITQDFKIKVLTDLKEGVLELHYKHIVVGDLNQYNLFVSKDAKVLFVDVDSYATDQHPHSGVLLDDIRDWTTQAINAATDTWAFDILTFWTLSYCHPFKWVAPGNTETLEQRVKASKSYLTKITGIKIPPLYLPPVGEVLKQFQDIFSGRRYMIDFHNAPQAVSMVIKQPINSATVLIRELYTNVTAVNACKNYLAVKKDGKWLLIAADFAKIVTQKKEFDCDFLYPAGNGKYAYVIKDTLHSDPATYSFTSPSFYYNNGSLLVLDYAVDRQYNFNLENQLSGIDRTDTPVFTKSIIIRDAPIQNFGAKKYLNIPVKNRYRLVPISFDTKNAYYCEGFVCTEQKKASKVTYRITNEAGTIEIDLDYFAYFAVSNFMVFVPENNAIIVYRNGTILTQMDVPNCTRDSRLFMTTSGIILFENNTLYLLNTK